MRTNHSRRYRQTVAVEQVPPANDSEAYSHPGTNPGVLTPQFARCGWLVLVLMVSAAFSAQAVISPPVYTIVDLGTAPGQSSQANWINNSNQVVGFQNGEVVAFVWTNGVLSALPGLGGIYKNAFGINTPTQPGAVGQAVGAAALPDIFPRKIHATLWTAGTVVDLGTLGGNTSQAYSINNQGQVVGYAVNGSGQQRGFLWQNGVNNNVMQDLTDLGGPFCTAYGINNLGHVVGNSWTTGHVLHAFFWQNGSMTDLGLLDPSASNGSLAQAINDNDQIVGYSYTVNNASYHAVLWTSTGAIQDIHALTGGIGGSSSYAWGINASGAVVGEATIFPNEGHFHAFIYYPGGTTMFDLNNTNFVTNLVTSLGRWELTRASSINDNGAIAGEGFLTVSNTTLNHTFVLVPPAPSQPVSPTIIWANPTDITQGTALSSVQLDAIVIANGQTLKTDGTDGTLTYTPQAGTILPVGDGQLLQVMFTPTDPTKYTGASAAATINVKAPTQPLISWATPADIVYGTALSGVQLDAIATIHGQPVAGTYFYNPINGTVLEGGNWGLSVTFKPTDTTLSTVTASVRITVQPAVLTVQAVNSARLYGAANAFTYTISGFVNGDPATIVSGTPGFTTAGAPTAPVGSYTITPNQGSLTLTKPNDYVFVFVNGTLTVNPLPLTITANAQTKVYRQADPTLTFRTSGPLVGSDSFSGALTRAPGENVGSYLIGQGTLALNSNYTLNYVGANLTITPAPLTVMANGAAKTYGQPVTFTGHEFTTSGLLINSDTVSSVTLSSAGAAATATVAGSPYSIVPSAAVGTGLGNYTITYANGSLTVNPAFLTITASNQSKTYGASLNLGSTAFTTSGLQNIDTVTSVTLSTTATASSPVGNYLISPSAAVGTGLGNYTITYVNGSLAVKPAPLTVAADNKTMVQGGVVPVLTASFSGFVAGDTAAVLSGSPALSTTATSSSLPGSYPITITQGTLSAANYSFNFLNGQLTITAAGGGCTRTIGYYKNHPKAIAPLPIYLGTPGVGSKALPVTNTKIGVAVESQSTYGTPDNGITKLYAQLLAAKLNILNGADGRAVNGVIQAADAFLATHSYNDWPNLSSADQQQVLMWQNTLDSYNNGLIGPGHCDNTEALICDGSNHAEISDDFNDRSFAPNQCLWFNSICTADGVRNGATVRLVNGAIQFVANKRVCTLNVPDALVIFSTTAPSTTTQFDKNLGMWVTTVPTSKSSGKIFLHGLAYAVPNGGLPGRIRNVKWSFDIFTDTPGVKLNWQWAASCYDSGFVKSDGTPDYDAIAVKPTDDNQSSQYKNSDCAGTSQGKKDRFVGRAGTGDGGDESNGSYSDSGQVQACVLDSSSDSGSKWSDQSQEGDQGGRSGNGGGGNGNGSNQGDQGGRSGNNGGGNGD